MGQTEVELAKKLAEARKKRIREQGIASLKSEIKKEKKAAFKARFGGAMNTLSSFGGFIKDVSKNKPLRMRKGKGRKTLLKQDVKLPKIF